ncbi:DUF2997 domain-containing protein [Vibrio sp. PNB22_8_1]|uniref:DUF2997 domain-containing protein n=1 Tax=unclassified Vibrio TaxID=2614977 RepID=UPI00406A677C
MPEQKVVITIDQDGAVSAKTSGFKGDTCLAALDELLDLDGAVTQVKKTDEYHQSQSQPQSRTQKIQGGAQ